MKIVGRLLPEAGSLTGVESLLLWRPRDPHFLHLVCQRRPLEAQANCRSTSASDNPIGFAERSQNLLSLGLFQCVWTLKIAFETPLRNHPLLFFLRAENKVNRFGS